MLCEFEFEKNDTFNNSTENATEIDTFFSEPAEISLSECLLIFWVFTFCCRLIYMVRNKISLSCCCFFFLENNINHLKII